MLNLPVRGVALLLTTIAANGGGLRVGAARVEITDLAPPAQPPSGKYAHERLFIRSIVLGNGTARAALIGADRADMDEPIWQIASKGVATELACPLQNIGFGTGQSYLNVCLDNIDPGSHLWTQTPNLAGIPDKTAAVIKFAAPSGALIAVYMTYAMHPANGYVSELTSADYAGRANSGYVPNDAAFGANTFQVLSSRLRPDARKTRW